MSHEIRTPINAIVGLTYLFERTSLDGRQRDYIEKIQLASNNLLSIVNDILDFSKIEAQKVTLESVTFDLEDVLRDVLRMNAYKAQEKGLEVNLELAADVPVRLTGDPARLGQVLLNLLSNAIKFTEKGGILVRVELDRRQEGWAVLRFAVADTGIGIAAEMKERIFGPFAQADSSTSRRFGGTGLGLAISRNLVEMMGGQLEVQSEPGEGSTFRFTATFGIAEPAVEAGRGLPGGRPGMSILVVDDNRTTLSILARLLAPRALQVATAGSGAEGLRKWRPGCDLLLVDSRLPDMDGLELVRRIRAMAGDDCAPRVLLMIGAGRPDLQRETEQIRVDGFLAKPFVPSDLVGAVSAAFGLVPEAEGAGGSGGGEGEAAAGRLAEARVLLVEDNEINRQVIRELLGSLGVRVTCAANGQEALQILDGGEERFEAILMDLQMPVMDGYQTAIRIRKNPRYREVPIIAITADVVSGVKDRVALAGMNAYLSKPIRIVDLVGALSRWIPVASGPPETGAGAGAAPSGPLAALKGIDARRGLSQANGNEALYRGLLASFAARWSGEVERLRRLLETGGREEAALSLHTLKGLAATLGAERLRAEAEAVERRLREPGAPEEPGGRALGALEEALQEVLASIEGLPAADPPPGRCGDAAGADGELAARLYPGLREMLRAHNGDAVEHFRHFSRAAGGEHQPALERVEKLICRYDFEEALVELEKLFGAPAQGPR